MTAPVGAAPTRAPRRAATAARRRDLTIDVAMLTVASLVVLGTERFSRVPSAPWAWMVAFPVAVLGLLALFGLYRQRTAPQFLDDVRAILGATAVAAMALTFIRVLVDDDPWTASQGVRSWVFASVYLIAGRGGAVLTDAALRRRGRSGRATLIIGAGRVGQMLAERLREHPEVGLDPVGFVDDDPRPVAADAGPPVLGSTDELEAIVSDHGVEHAILCFSLASHETQLAIEKRLSKLRIPISIVPRLFEAIPDRTRLERIVGLPLLSTYPTDPRGWQFAVKYAFDRVAAALIILLLSPLLLLLALAVLIDRGRPILFRQRRVGRDGREFDMLKFRTMAGDPHAHGEADSAWAARITGEPAATEGDMKSEQDSDRHTSWVGNGLRHYGLDELPQLFNVLRGEMSLIGPRPERESYVRMFTGSVHRYGERHRVKAGITGWAQVHGLRGETSLGDRVEWDNYYIENWSLWLDLKILMLTALAVLRRRTR